MQKTKPEFGPNTLEAAERQLVGLQRQRMLHGFFKEICRGHNEEKLDVREEGFEAALKQEAREEYVFRHALGALFAAAELSLARKTERACSAIGWHKGALLGRLRAGAFREGFA